MTPFPASLIQGMSLVLGSLLLGACIVPTATAQSPQPAPEAAPQKAPPSESIIISPEVSATRMVTFRIQAPDARSVTLKGLRHHLPDEPMVKDSSGLWSVTVGPLAPDFYSYQLVIDSATVTDPSNREIRKYFTNESMLEVPGTPPMLASVQAVPHGVIHHQTYASKVRNADAGVWIYTPPGYDPRASTLYPVVYLQHGYGDSEESWINVGRANSIVDNLIAQHRIRPMIVVMPDGHPIRVHTREAVKGYYASNTPALQSDLLGQVIPLIEGDYRADPSPEKRAIVGLSMGGGQALSIGRGNLGIFKWVGAFSSAVPEGDPGTTFAGLVKDKSLRPDLLWLGTGKSDVSHVAQNEALHLWLQQNGIVHTWVLSDGAHDWTVWRAYLPQFLELVFQ